MPSTRTEYDSLGPVVVSADKLWGARTQRSLEHFSIGTDLIPREMITAYVVLKKAAANANFAGGRRRPSRTWVPKSRPSSPVRPGRAVAPDGRRRQRSGAAGPRLERVRERGRASAVRESMATGNLFTIRSVRMRSGRSEAYTLGGASSPHPRKAGAP